MPPNNPEEAVSIEPLEVVVRRVAVVMLGVAIVDMG